MGDFSLSLGLLPWVIFSKGWDWSHDFFFFLRLGPVPLVIFSLGWDRSCLPVYLSVCLSACIPVCLSACLPASLSACPCSYFNHVCQGTQFVKKISQWREQKLSVLWQHKVFRNRFPKLFLTLTRIHLDNNIFCYDKVHSMILVSYIIIH